MVVIPAIAIWFWVVQAAIVNSFCPWCCLAHGLAVAGVIALFFSRRSKAGAPPARDTGLAPTAALLDQKHLLLV